MHAIHFDPFSGAGGDMIVAALLDLGCPLEAIREALSPAFPAELELASREVMAGAIRAIRFEVKLPEEHVHRNLENVFEVIESSRASTEAIKQAKEVFSALAAAESKVHGVPVEEVHFHEVGALDSIVDVLAACVALDSLGVRRVTSAPVALGSGSADSAHGPIPVPAPATLELLRGVPVRQTDVGEELCTPTAAAVFSTVCVSWGPLFADSIEAVGYGAGTRDPGPLPNVLRAILYECPETVEAPFPAPENLVVLETTIDDTSPETIGYLFEKAQAAGALELTATPTVGKKSRPAVRVSVLVRPQDVNALSLLLFRETSTLGVRSFPVRRMAMKRETKTVTTPWGKVRVVVGLLDGKAVTRSPEYEDCARIARDEGVPLRSVYEAVLRGFADAQGPAARG